MHFSEESFGCFHKVPTFYKDLYSQDAGQFPRRRYHKNTTEIIATVNMELLHGIPTLQCLLTMITLFLNDLIKCVNYFLIVDFEALDITSHAEHIHHEGIQTRSTW